MTKSDRIRLQSIIYVLSHGSCKNCPIDFHTVALSVLSDEELAKIAIQLILENPNFKTTSPGTYIRFQKLVKSGKMSILSDGLG